MGTRFRSGFSVAVIVVACFALFGIDSVRGANRELRNVQVAVRAKWSGTPVLLEAGELLSKEWKDGFWDFVEVWLHSEPEVSDSNSAKDCVKKIIKHGRSLLTEPLGSVFELSLLMRSASPRLVVYRQLAEESLSSFAVSDESSNSKYVTAVSSETNRNLQTKRSDSLLVGVNPTSPGGKCCWVDTGRALFFDVADLQLWLHNLTSFSGEAFWHPELFEFDHVYFESSLGSPVAILYGALGTECFRDFHVALIEAAKKGRVIYVVRSVLPSGCEAKAGLCGAVGTSDSMNLGGYGVELALKNMEYKAMDDSTIRKGVTLEDPRTEDLSQEVRGFIFSKLLEHKPDLTSEVMAFRDYLLSSTVSDTLDVWELKDLGHQTVQRIVQASDPLQSMQDINQNFPTVVSSLSRMKLNVSVKDEILSNQKMIPPGKSLLALNGALVNIEDIDLYELVDIVHQELSLADQFLKLKIPGTTVRKLLSTMPPAEDNKFRVDFRSTHVHYINNLEEDDMYKRWGSNLHEILMPAVPGKSQHIRKNLLHAVFVLDPATICGLESIGMIRSLYDKKFPLRFGLILYSSKLIKDLEMSGGEIHSSAVENDNQIEDMSTLIIRLFIYIKENRGNRKAFRFLSNVNKLRTESKSSKDDTLKIDHIERAYVETLLPKAKSPPQDTLLELKKKKQTHREQSEDSSMLVLKLGLVNLQCCLLMNGLVFDSNQEALLNAMGEEFRRIQEQVYYRQIDPHTDVLDKILSQNGIARYNPKITGNGKLKPRFVSLSNSFLGGDSVLNDISYLHSPKTIDDVKPVTHILVVDITSKRGMKLLHEGIRYLIGGCKGSRLGVLFGANQDTDDLSSLFVKVFNITAYSYSHKKNVLYFMDKLCSFYEQNYLCVPALTTEDARRFMDKVSELAYANGLPSKAYKTAFSEFSFEKTRKHMKKAGQFLYGLLGPECGLNIVVTNGRVYPIDETNFMSHDLTLLELVEFKRRVKQIAEIIEDVKWENVDPDMLTSKFISDVIMYVSSMIAARERSSERARFDLLNAQYSAIVRGDKNSGVHIDAVVDPLSSSGQKFASILRLLGKCIKPSLRIVLNPLSSLVDLPLKSYYRYVVPTMDDFSSTGYTVSGPKAFFANMPLSKTLTMNLDVPEPWLVEPVIAVHDLDNILLDNLGDTRTLQAVFELEALILTGQCSEDDPPQGLQLILGTKTTPHMVDTIVMVNLGYWQMKVSPGVWYLQLAPGRSSELYILKEEGDGSQQKSKPKRITINDLRGKVVRLEAVKKKGRERETLLVTDDDNKSQKTKGNGDDWNSNLFKWASDLIVGNDPSEKNESASLDHKKVRRHGKAINIFSIASGHLYERFLKIMILSVLKNTQRPVKFWFIKNYLSPPFKDVIPHMAKEYGFEYELITYKWPSWLHKQKEKQRLIWAYKILFLDVIFPLSLEKVIYVDADQIVRTDMGELYDMDIKGRPLAYTPFCDNNKDMDGYRFWQQGFWKEHLRGRPYHISALYVVDLKKFRVTAAGDNLRVVYETLSKDPNSLANLDQDLPNYAQHAVPIFSLPQEWLWCESWCGNATKSKAKTIDLCNNPMTKEPKLQGARRIVPEWPDLDLEARRFTARIMGEEVEQEPSPPANESMEAPIHSFTEEILSNKSEL